ncbi:conserved hypothetical protein [Hyphomicrobiales bacterium]|nr:conserved hypothetical protein [Hyphomicrobiales bacterium]CAH1701089.1 conserved hypothetical protein [Hyphomicrobiales bacterium]CAI0344150.1 conserved hypothetical protein [Hyphomicrobiales bacterium]
MRPERVRRIQVPYTVSGLVRAPRAANDNAPTVRGGAMRRIVRRPLLVGMAAAALILALGWFASGGHAL